MSASTLEQTSYDYRMTFATYCYEVLDITTEFEMSWCAKGDSNPCFRPFQTSPSHTLFSANSSRRIKHLDTCYRLIRFDTAAPSKPHFAQKSRMTNRMTKLRITTDRYSTNGGHQWQ